ncbi:MAG TPA: hypothetical protein G4N92_08170 [Anaerolineae bacterium]|nr:hypothetical protein [Anaerolineae bacterium]
MIRKDNNIRAFTCMKIFLCFSVILFFGASCDPGDGLIEPPELPCNWAEVSHINLPDGSIIEPLSGRVEKIWSIKNVGICDWDTSYTIESAWGDLSTLVRDVEYPTSLPGPVAPGESFELPLRFEAPCVPGKYNANFYISGFKDGEEELFGVGPVPGGTLEVPIHWHFEVPQYLHVTDILIRWYSSERDDYTYTGPCPTILGLKVGYDGYFTGDVDIGAVWVSRYSTSEGYLGGGYVIITDEWLNYGYPYVDSFIVRDSIEDGEVRLFVNRPDYLRSNTLTYSVTCTEETMLIVPAATPTSVIPNVIPEAIALKDANCRTKPGDEFKAVGNLPKGESAPIVGRNLNFTWLLLDLPDLEQNCWVWKELLSWEGDLDGVEVIPAEQLGETEQEICSGLSQQDCEARSDCQWVDTAGQPAYCTDK